MSHDHPTDSPHDDVPESSAPGASVDGDSSAADDTDDDDVVFSSDELDSLYRQTLDTMEQAELAVQQAWQEIHADDDAADDDAADPAGNSDADGESGGPSGEAEPGPPGESATGTVADELDLYAAMASTGNGNHPSVTPLQVLEAALFVGGEPLTLRQLHTLLRGRFDREAIVLLLDELNRKYEAELRPYEVQPGEGGYRLTLRDEYEPIRNRVFGLGPREIRLSHDHLEVLSLVAYQQPVTREAMEDAAGRGVAGVLRQLLRRELIAIDRDPDQPKTIRYVSTDRFLQVFGLGGLDELPQADELNFR